MINYCDRDRDRDRDCDSDAAEWRITRLPETPQGTYLCYHDHDRDRDRDRDRDSKARQCDIWNGQ
jgi:hypothetical protein